MSSVHAVLLDLWDTTAWGEIPPDERLITQLGVADAVLFDGFERTRRYRGSGGPSAAQAVFADDQPDYCGWMAMPRAVASSWIALSTAAPEGVAGHPVGG